MNSEQLFEVESVLLTEHLSFISVQAQTCKKYEVHRSKSFENEIQPMISSLSTVKVTNFCKHKLYWFFCFLMANNYFSLDTVRLQNF